MRPGRRAGTVAMLLAAVAFLSSACGSRLAQREIVAANAGQLTAGQRAASSSGVGGGATDVGAGNATADAGVAGGSAQGGQGSGGQRTATAAAVAANAAKGASSSSGGGAKAPIRIGSVSTLSGPAGGAQSPGARALQVWAKWVNARGGINGHTIEVFTADDGGDPARHAAAVRDMVENKKVIAFVNQWASGTHQGAADYLASKRIPVVGGDATHVAFWSNPMYFPQVLHFEDLFRGTLLTAARFVQGRNLGTLVCREGQICADAARGYKSASAAAGFKVVYEGQGSVAQPDFTGECLAAKNANVDLLAAIFDANSVKRVARSCAAQGFHPKFVIGYGISDGGTATMPEFEGSVGATGAFPFVVDSTPASREFHEAYRKYAPGEELSQASAVGWVAAKLFEKAAQQLGDQPTSAQVLDGLWSIKNDDLGGLTSPLTFVKDQPSPRAKCYFALRILGGAYAAPDGADPKCF